jgi:hypothetical protein
MNEIETYEKVKSEILEGIKEIAMVNPDAAEYLKNNIVFDDGKMTFCYIGDDRIKIIKKET